MTPPLEAVRDAAAALSGVAVRTPLLESPEANETLGGRLLLKAESMQRTGAFKIRGAYNRMRLMTDEERVRGVVTYSSGNHALGVAVAARLLGSSSVIVMPSDAPHQKIEAVRALGAEVVTYDRDTEKSADVVGRIIAESGRIELPPSGNPDVHAGAATIPLELLEQAGEKDTALDAVLIPCGGGGLTAMTAYVMAEMAPKTAVYAVEPAAFDDTRRSLDAGERLTNPVGRRTICDSIMTPMPNPHTFAINKRYLTGGLVADDDAVHRALRFAYDHFKIVVEPGAAVGIAAVLEGEVDIAGRTIATVITGGNVATDRFCDLLHTA